MHLEKTFLKLVAVFAIAAVVVFLESCGKPPGIGDDPSDGSDHQTQMFPIDPTFAAINQYIIQPKCIKCHSTQSSSGQPAGHDDFTTYDGVMSEIVAEDPEGSKFYQDVASGKMPKHASPLNELELKAISDWITSGAENN